MRNVLIKFGAVINLYVLSLSPFYQELNCKYI